MTFKQFKFNLFMLGWKVHDETSVQNWGVSLHNRDWWEETITTFRCPEKDKIIQVIYRDSKRHKLLISFKRPRKISKNLMPQLKWTEKQDVISYPRMLEIITR